MQGTFTHCCYLEAIRVAQGPSFHGVNECVCVCVCVCVYLRVGKDILCHLSETARPGLGRCTHKHIHQRGAFLLGGDGRNTVQAMTMITA